MTQKMEKIITTACGIVLSVLVTVAGLCLAGACVVLWRAGGDDPFTREGVAAALKRIALPLYICLGGVLAVGLFSLLLPASRATQRPMPDRREARDRALSAIQPDTLDAETAALLAAEGKRRRAWRLACGILMAVAALLVLLYLLIPTNFDAATVTADVIAATCVALPAAGVAAAAGILLSAKQDASYKAEANALRLSRTKGAYPAKKGDLRRSREQNDRRARITRIATRSAVAFFGVLFVVLGVLNGGMLDVLEKAAKICTECIGLG